MDNGLKQRLIGALVLLALGVLFVPVLFEPADRRTVDHTTQIPPAPDITPFQVNEPSRNADIEPIKPVDEMYHIITESDEGALSSPNVEVEIGAETGVENEIYSQKNPDSAPNTQSELVEKKPEPDRKILNDEGLPEAWYVQVGSFSQEDRAVTLRDQLLKDDLPAFIRTFTTSKGAVTRVYVGPKIDRDKATELKALLDKSLKIKSLVVRFSP